MAGLSEKKRVLVNAVSARFGGAKTVFDLFCYNLQEDCVYVILAPHKPEYLREQDIWIHRNYSGIFALLFAAVFVGFYAWRYRCSSILSFSNFNFMFPGFKKITYFHNILILVDNSIKFKLIRFLLKLSVNETYKYVFQTNYVKKQFFYTISEVDYIVKWPGLNAHETTENTEVELTEIVNLPDNLSFEKIFVLPITDVNDSHRNYDFLLELKKQIQFSNYLFIVTSEGINDIDNVYFSGKLSRENFRNLVSLSDGLLVLSKLETVCLPIFEALSQSKPVFCYEADYVVELKSMFPNVESFFTFSTNEGFFSLVDNDSVFKAPIRNDRCYLLGDWNII